MACKFTLLAVVLAVMVLYAQAQDTEDAAPTEDAATPEDNGNAEVKCRKREELSECGNRCQEPKCQASDEVCEEGCQPGCYCVKGTARNDFGHCVPKGMCGYKNYIG